MYHSITIYPKGKPVIDAYATEAEKAAKRAVQPGYNTWDDWHLIPSSLPVVAPAIERTNFVDIPRSASAKKMDLSYYNDEPVFNDRSGSWEFYIDNGYWEKEYPYMNPNKYPGQPSGSNASSVMDILLHALESGTSDFTNTSEMRIELEDEPGYFYLGRVYLDGTPTVTKGYSKVKMSYSIYPYKFSRNTLSEDWEWDSFNFDTDLATENLNKKKFEAGETYIFHMPPSDIYTKIEYTISGKAAVDIYQSDLDAQIGSSNTPEGFGDHEACRSYAMSIDVPTNEALEAGTYTNTICASHREQPVCLRIRPEEDITMEVKYIPRYL